MKLAIFLPNWIGDAVMATPALRAIRTEFSGSEIVGVLRSNLVELLEGLDLLDRLVVCDPRGRSRDQRGWRLIRALRGERFDIAVLFPNSLRSAFVAFASGAKRRVGFARDGRKWLLTDPLSPRPRSTPHPVIDEYLRLAAHLGCANLSRNMELATLPADHARLDAFWSRRSPEARQRGVVCFNPGGAYGSSKHWPVKSFGDLARRVAEELGRTVLVLCGPAERDEARAIVARASHPRVLSLADEPPSLGIAKAAVREAELLVTTDSGPRHFAPPFGVPVVTLFGPTHIAWSETYYERAVHLQHPVDCGPCQRRVCPLKHHRCMRDLSVERVFREVAVQLEKYGSNRAAA